MQPPHVAALMVAWFWRLRRATVWVFSTPALHFLGQFLGEGFGLTRFPGQELHEPR